MKNVTSFILVSAVLCVPQAYGAEVKQSTQSPGRYQLFQGEYLFVNIKGEGFKEKALFKIDTSTGELFICDGRQFDGKFLGKPGKLIQRHSCKPFEQELTLEMPK